MVRQNPCNLLLPTAFQRRFMFDDLMARRTARQEPRHYWGGKGMGGSTAVNGQLAIRGVLDGVVDALPHARLANLRVVDALVMRDCKANTALTTIMIGEKWRHRSVPMTGTRDWPPR